MMFCFTLCQTTNFRLFQTKRVLQTTISNLKKKNDKKFLKQVENTGGKGETARYEQFLFSLSVFKTYTADT